MSSPDRLRRRILLTSLGLPVLPGLQACAPLLPALPGGATPPEAAELLAVSARAHGLAAFAKFTDLSVSYTGHWHRLVARLQPALVDAGFRGESQERLLLRDGLVAQAHTGPRGHKYVVRRTVGAERGELGQRGAIRVWFNGEESQDEERLAAAALVVDGYGLFLTGPMWLVESGHAERSHAERSHAERSWNLRLGPRERITVNGEAQVCDVLRVQLVPGLGCSAADRLTLYIDSQAHLLRRVRFSLDGLESTRGAVAEVDTFDHVTIAGVVWPTNFYERLLRPLPLAVHRWRLTGLDVNRGLEPADVDGGTFLGRAEAPAGALVSSP
jgi:hypothetical protein